LIIFYKTRICYKFKTVIAIPSSLAFIWQRFATSRFGSNENIFPDCQSFETFTWLTVSASKLNWSQINFYSLGLSKLRPLDSRHRQPIGIVLLCVCWRVENGSAQWRKTPLSLSLKILIFHLLCSVYKCCYFINLEFLILSVRADV
jgi:hypothetical protein